jgi:hypothetical protein
MFGGALSINAQVFDSTSVSRVELKGGVEAGRVPDALVCGDIAVGGAGGAALSDCLEGCVEEGSEERARVAERGEPCFVVGCRMP